MNSCNGTGNSERQAAGRLVHEFLGGYRYLLGSYERGTGRRSDFSLETGDHRSSLKLQKMPPETGVPLRVRLSSPPGA